MKMLMLLISMLVLVNLSLADTTDVIIGNQQVGNTIPFWGSDVTDFQMYDMNGRLVRSLAVDETMSTAWDLKDKQGKALPAGVYVIRCGMATGRVVVFE